MSVLLLLAAVCAVTYTFEIIFGLAGTIMMLAVMNFFYDSKTLVIFSVLPQIIVATIGLLRSPLKLELPFLFKMLSFAIIGAVIGVFLFYIFPPAAFHKSLAITIMLAGLYLLVAPKKIIFKDSICRLLDVIAGLSQSLFGISGPIAMTRLLSTFDKKIIIRNYAFGFFLSLNIIRALSYGINNVYTPQIGLMMMVTGPVLILTLWFSNQLHLKVNDALFRKVASWVIVLGGIMMYLNST